MSSSSSSSAYAPSTSAYWQGTEISQISNLTFSGSSGYVSGKMPRCIGSIVRPSGDASRTLSLKCSWHIEGFSKSDIEQYQKNLGTYMSCFNKGTLSVHGNTYEDIVPKSVVFEDVIHNKYFVYTIEFELAYNSRAFNAQVFPDIAGGARSGLFTYTYGDANQSLSTFDFPMYQNLDMVINTSFGLQTFSRGVRSEGAKQVLSGGEHTFSVKGWITDHNVQALDAYFYNFICSVGPLGKKGTFRLGGKVYDNCVFTNMTSEESSGGDDRGVDGSSVNYTMEFVRGVC